MPHCPEPKRDPAERLRQMTERLKAHGHRLTPQRLAILRVLATSTGHPSVEDIHKAILADFPTTSLATVYKTITRLKDENEVLELQFSDHPNRYDGNTPHPHPHVICTRCGAICDPDFPPLADLARQVSEQTGFRITTHRLDFYGLCPTCQEKK